MRSPLPAFLCNKLATLSILLLPTAAFSQVNYDIGLSYRHNWYSEASLGYTHMVGENLSSHELDANFRFDIGNDRNFRGTFVLGWTKYEHADFQYPDILSISCYSGTYASIAQEYHAYRFNPGIEYEMHSGKINYGCGAGIFYYGTFGGNQAELYMTYYTHRDSATNECVEDSSFFTAATNKAPKRAIALVGLSAHMYCGYEAVQGITFFVMGGVNPTWSLGTHTLSVAPSVSAGVYFRFQKRFTNPE